MDVTLLPPKHKQKHKRKRARQQPHADSPPAAAPSQPAPHPVMPLAPADVHQLQQLFDDNLAPFRAHKSLEKTSFKKVPFLHIKSGHTKAPMSVKGGGGNWEHIALSPVHHAVDEAKAARRKRDDLVKELRSIRRDQQSAFNRERNLFRRCKPPHNKVP